MYLATVAKQIDYYPFGMIMDQRSTSTAGYRYCYNGKENDNEVKGEGNQQDYGFRIYDPRVARFLSVDPDVAKYPSSSGFEFAFNNSIRLIDINGRGPGDVVVVIAGADFYSDKGVGSVKEISDHIQQHDFRRNGGYVNSFSSLYWGVSMHNTTNMNTATQDAYDAVLKNYNKHHGKSVEGGSDVIYGYSWGGVLAMHLAKRLEKDGIKVDLLVTVDAANGKLSDKIDRTVPSNVVENLNLFQTKPSIINSRGYPNQAEDESSTAVVNKNLTGKKFSVPQGGETQIEHGTIDEATHPQVKSAILEAVNRSKP